MPGTKLELLNLATSNLKQTKTFYLGGHRKRAACM